MFPQNLELPFDKPEDQSVIEHWKLQATKIQSRFML